MGVELRDDRGQFLYAVIADAAAILPTHGAAHVDALPERPSGEAGQPVVRADLSRVAAELRVRLALELPDHVERRVEEGGIVLRRGLRPAVVGRPPRVARALVDDCRPNLVTLIQILAQL